MYTITLLVVSVGQAKSLLMASLVGIHCPASQAAGTQVGQPVRLDAGQPSAGMGYYP